ncbi:DUF192 domain-containing protein [Mesorhizobium sp. LHD-90]|uniref:DUF192 domain-containing protein n=1 Tax=Mesorhizobium sp. LHD-90 TaxID=3071414 RepID=UPI0027E08A43|nr:DUF192 domain-containing protein [Mesorhizobium sp. LHD-90]MDQ6437162.1 DUF192 domain-containing protein [Mesorhizobium sp. LHD-90]
MPRKPWIFAGTATVAALAAAAFLFLQTTFPATSQAQNLPVDPAPLVAITASGVKSFGIEVADDPAERSTGLMFRETMPQDRGMLFVFENTQPASFWMKNTPLPLDLVFIGEDGRVRAVKQGEPQSEAVISPGVPVRFVLELNAGVAERTGIVAGTEIRHPAIDRAAGG